MTWQALLAVALTVTALLLLSLTRLRPHVVMLAVLMVLAISGVLTPEQAFAGFSNAGVITVAAMFVVATGIYASGAADLLVDKVLGSPRSERGALARIFTPVLVLSGFLNNTPVVAAMIPPLTAWSRKIGISTSKLMIPLSYCAILGGTLTLIGTSTNLVVNGQYQQLTGEAGFGLFTITPVGIAAALAGLLVMLVFFPLWLPDRRADKGLGNMREFTLEVSVDPQGPLVHRTIAEAGLRGLQRIYLVEIERDGNVITAVPPEVELQANDRLVFAGDTEAISDLLRIKGIIPSPETGQESPLDRQHWERCLVEAVVSPHCAAVGQTIRDAQFRDRYGAVILAVARNGERVGGNLGRVRLMAGDTLLLEARPAFITRQRYNKDFLLINDLGAESPRHELAWLAWGILGLIVVIAALGLTSMLNASLIGAALMVGSGCCTVNQAGRGIDFPVLATIAASFSLGIALQTTGAATVLAENLISLSNGNPLLMLVLTYVTVSLLTEVVTNNAAALVMLPITLELTERAQLNSEPFVIAIMMAASASFATPLGYQTNLMVYGPGNYRYRDFLKVGIPMNLLTGMVTLIAIYLLWPLATVNP
ncbi:MAG: hypothetical protein RLZZ385_2147 [Pseudomonadota bacterium]|jgi:di/tricarboxylate transporter